MAAYKKPIKPGSGVFIPAGTWHNIVNTGDTPLKLFTVYAPPHHPHGTVHETKEIADAAEQD
jgi:mannose-6-phosphate isomerase-like protein (cupin superfamily)